MRKSRPIVVLVTASAKEVNKISRALLKQKKVACVNIIPRVLSLFWWQGKIDSANEVLLMMKTKAHLFDDIVRLVKKLHSYEVPEVIAWSITKGNKDYLRWIDESVNR